MPAKKAAEEKTFFSRQAEMAERLFLANLGLIEETRSKAKSQYGAWIKDGKAARKRYEKNWKEFRSDVESRVNDIRDQISDRFESLTETSK